MSQRKCWDFEWPKDSLDNIQACPVCGCQENELFLDNLADNAFFVAPGKWNLYQCKGCNSAYLNPRPDPGSIHKAYGTYYTHEIPSGGQLTGGTLRLIQRLRKSLANGFYNRHYGTNIKPFFSLGAWLLLLYPRFQKSAKSKFRYQKKPESGQKLLDVGCGNGDFLLIASEAGWEVKGVEPDPKALEVARARDLDVVCGSLEEIVDSQELFDVITMSHVIEHVHDPVGFVKLAYKCLKPGGILYIDTPNIESLGVKRFGKNWRGIEAPRHLVIFSESGLSSVLNEVGFRKLHFVSRWEVRANIWLKSYRMELGKSPYHRSPKRLPLMDSVRCLLPRRFNCEEFLTVIARKI